MHTYADTAPSGLSDAAYDAQYGTGVDPARVPPSQSGPTYFLWDPQPLPMSHCCAVMIQSPHTLLMGTCPFVPAGKMTT